MAPLTAALEAVSVSPRENFVVCRFRCNCLFCWSVLDGVCVPFFFLKKYLPQEKRKPPSVTPAYNPDDPFNDEERERLQVEALARKFENKYVRSYNSFIHSFIQPLLLICTVIAVQSFHWHRAYNGHATIRDYPPLLIADTKTNEQVIYVLKINRLIVQRQTVSACIFG